MKIQQNHRSKRLYWGINKHTQDACQQWKGKIFQDYWRT